MLYLITYSDDYTMSDGALSPGIETVSTFTGGDLQNSVGVSINDCCFGATLDRIVPDQAFILPEMQVRAVTVAVKSLTLLAQGISALLEDDLAVAFELTFDVLGGPSDLAAQGLAIQAVDYLGDAIRPLGAEGAWLRAGDEGARLSAGKGDDLILGGDGDDRLFARAGADLVDGGDGSDRIKGGGGRDQIDGGGGDDDLSGNKGHDNINGQRGNDTLKGGKGDDWLKGDAGNDLLNGSKGRDILAAGPGMDTLTGGAGRDVFVFSPNADVNTVTDFQNGRDRLEWTSFIGVTPVFEALRLEQVGGDTWIRFNVTTIILEGIDVQEISRADFNTDLRFWPDGDVA